ncbi:MULTISPECIES: SDR family NAD(P)-dependent oxidoreductase [unclassified Cupriavidus]|uniref:SDR family NAD(P)-dependent oxidoreductase n=1 Tax=unclassified Cupriavidus TaxID=2640874 RepID=UPI00088C421A|nr:SDR family oxidoreductase [Cupriavidus sp. YR651]SDD49838.1 Short-chain dehydrogenase [Cupriavidus sp. YR651]
METAAAPRHVVITGAAGALGRAVASRFAAEGARLALIDRDLQHLQSVFAHPEPDHGGMLLHAADVTSDTAMGPVSSAILDAFGTVDVLVHVAGGFEMGEPTHALSRESWMRMMDLNAWSFVAVTGHFIPAMVFQRSGKVVAVTARGALAGAAAMGAYSASKSALQRLVESLSHEVRGAGINVNSIAPGILDTPANRQAMPSADPTRWVSTGVAARTVAFLASDAAQAVHGQHLVLDGLS